MNSFFSICIFKVYTYWWNTYIQYIYTIYTIYIFPLFFRFVSFLFVLFFLTIQIPILSRKPSYTERNSKTTNKETQLILSALCPWICNSTRPQHTLQMFANYCDPRQTIPWETINLGLLQPQEKLYPIQTMLNHRSRDQLPEFRTRQLAVSSSFKGISSALNFHESTGTDGTRTRTQSERRIDWANLNEIVSRECTRLPTLRISLIPNLMTGKLFRTKVKLYFHSALFQTKAYKVTFSAKGKLNCHGTLFQNKSSNT